jgi:hypothetical protein
MRRLVLLGLLFVCLPGAAVSAAVEQAGAAEPRQRVRLPAGTTVRLVGTNVVCTLATEGGRVNCSRFIRSGGRVTIANGEHEIVLQANRHVYVNQLRNRKYEFVFGRFPGPAAGNPSDQRPVTTRRKVYNLLPDKEFWVPGSRIVCQVAVASRKPLRAAIQCGFADARGRVPAPNTYGASFGQDGTAAVFRFSAARKPTVVYNSKTNVGKKTVKLPLNGTLVYRAGVGPTGIGLACLGATIQGAKAIMCSRGSANDLPNDYTFGILEEGTTIVLQRTPAGTVARFAVEGSGVPGGRSELPSAGEVFFAEDHDQFKLAATDIVCIARGRGDAGSLTCGIAARNGYAPLSHSASIRFDGIATVTRHDRRGVGTVVYRSERP